MMNKQQTRTICAGLAFITLTFGVAMDSQAEFVSLDRLSSGDNGITLDTSTDLEWLDLNLTTSLSVTGAEAIHSHERWRAATFTEVKTLIGKFFDLDPTASNVRETSGIDQAEANEFVSLFGATFEGAISWGRFQNSDNFAGHAIIRNDSNLSYLLSPDNYQAFNLYEPHSFSGVFLVREHLSAVPLPAAAWLFASALGIFGYLGRRRAPA
ncbi:VPLPA-CTERM sorting domain-containing protein [Thiocapsa bogorovii]|uniref:VPLPA-CTERM sorting domain-containing protein n=1 Tax=Thiocapsa bogorovii TaxID=521689 RepID=UPI001E392EDD|nr:VPLPA-CTERM sorting domain-containing protein [Thiocapsa bogorovii]UHD18577.1 VPLPA-CTERM sorting domain-containing protein [Thiocapsa bogorovii]